MECEIVIRAATPQDREARTTLIKRAVTSYDVDVFYYFTLQELTLQLSLLLGAALFIFCSAPLGVMTLVPLGLLALIALTVYVMHRVIADRHVANMQCELAGFVAEYRGEPIANPRAATVHFAEGGPPSDDPDERSCLVGSVSVSEYNGPRRSGWLHGLSVDLPWRRRGVGGALLTAARKYAVDARLESLEVAMSVLQPKARSLLLAHGWALRGTYHRKLLGEAVTLPMLHMGLELPRA